MTHLPAAGRRPRAVRRRLFAVAAVVAAILCAPSRTAAQDSALETLAFLLTPRSIDTGDAVADAEAAGAVSRAIAGSLQDGLALLPAATSPGGFTFRLDNTLGGAAVRASAFFGPVFTERALTAGPGTGSLDLQVRRMSFGAFDGRALREGTLLSTASRLAGEADPVDVESIALRIDASVATFTGTYGLADRLDVTGIVPMVRVTLRGARTDTFRGRTVPVSSAESTTSGLGDIALRLKYNPVRRFGGGLAVTMQLRLPTGRDEDLLGAGETTVQPGVAGSFERGRVAVDGHLGYQTGGASREIAYGGAVTVMGTPRLMLIGEIAGRRLESAGQLVEIAGPHARLIGIDTIRLSAADGPGQRVAAVGAVKWNASGPWLISASVLRRLTTGGLTAAWVPGLSLEYVFGR